MLERFGRAIYRIRWPVAICWLLITVGGAFIAPRITSVLHGGGYTIGNSQSVAAYNVLHHAYGYRAQVFTVVFDAGPQEKNLLIPAARHFREEVGGRFGKRLGVKGPYWTPDRAVVFEQLYSSPQGDFGASLAKPLNGLFPPPPVHTYLTGSSAIFHDMESVSDQDLQHIELITLPLAAAILLLIFGSVMAAIVPVVMAPVSVTLALALIYFLGRRIDMSIFVLNTASMLGLGVAIDYSLFMVHRFREELSEGRCVEDAVGRTVATSGRAILVSAVVVTIGFLSLSLTGVSMLRSIGLGGSIVVALSLIVALTLLPAVLGILGPRISLLPVVPEMALSRAPWLKLAHVVMRRPFRVILAVIGAVVVLALPAAHLRVGIPGPQILPPSVSSREGYDLLAHHLGLASQSPVLVVIKRKPDTPLKTFRPAALALLDHVCGSHEVAGLSADPGPHSPKQIYTCRQTLNRLQSSRPNAGLRTEVRTHNVALISAFLKTDPSSAAAEDYVRSLRNAPPIPGYQVLIGGQTAGQMDFDSSLYSRFPLVILFVIATIYLILLIAFRSLLLPLKAVLMNLFSIAAAYGVITFSFQDGRLASLLGFTPVGNIDSIVPVFLFSVLFGISTDYEVFLLTRVQEEYQLSGDNTFSVAQGLAATGRIITSAALIMIVVFGAFSFARLVVIKELGLGLAAAVLIDATLIRILLAPAMMRLIGRWNWWLPYRGFERVEKEETADSKISAAR
ncbi:MAG: MMPL family transporter [Chloroflexota bacterium]